METKKLRDEEAQTLSGHVCELSDYCCNKIAASRPGTAVAELPINLLMREHLRG
jgi:hypothetical protein